MTIVAFSMMNINGDPGNEKETSSTKEHPFGTRMVIGDRIYKYVKVGAVAIANGGLLMAAPIGIPNHEVDLVIPSASAVGANSIVVTLGSTAATEDQYADGYVYYNGHLPANKSGEIYKIRQHNSVLTGGEATLNLYDGDTVKTATVASSTEVGIAANPYNGIIISPASAATSLSMGVSTGPMDATTATVDSFGWVQTWGYAPLLCSTLVYVLDAAVRKSDNTAGAAEAFNSDASAEDYQLLGYSTLVIPAAGDYGLVDLRISA